MKKWTLIISTVLLFTQIISCINYQKYVSVTYYKYNTYQDSIKQNIGGLLIREISYCDHYQPVTYDIKYSYKNKLDSSLVIGTGSYFSQKPPKDEQLIQLENWTILKTCRDSNKDVLYINKDSLNIWTEFEISPETIENSDLWKKQNIKTLSDNSDNVSKINKIDSIGNITVLYTYAKKNRIFSFIKSKRKIIYKFDFLTGKLEMTKILKL